MEVMAKAFSVFISALDGFIGLYSVLNVVLGISLFSAIAVAFWAITRFIILPIFGGNYGFSDSGDDQIITETVTESSGYSDSTKSQSVGNGFYRRQHRGSTKTTTTTTRRRVRK